MFLSILNRTIFLELAKVFALSLVGITGLLLMAGIVSEASREGLGPQQILAIVPLIIPGTLPYTIPATTLFASCVIYGRLSADNEILAIKSAGVNVMRIVGPGLFLGLAMSLGTYGLYYALIPATRHMLRTLFVNDIENLLYGVLEREGQFKHPKLEYEIYVNRVQGRKLLDAQFMHRDPSGTRYDAVARADEADLRCDIHNKKILVHMANCSTWSPGEKSVMFLRNRMLEVDLPQDIFQNQKSRPSDMTWGELIDSRAEILQTIEKLETNVANQVSLLATTAPPDSLPQHLHNLRERKQHERQRLLDVDLELHRRPALAAGCLCFVLVGCPVGIWFSRSDYLSAFVTCFLPIVLIYYPLLLCGLNLARSGKVPLLVGAWGANGIIGLVAFGLYRRLLKN